MRRIYLLSGALLLLIPLLSSNGEVLSDNGWDIEILDQMEGPRIWFELDSGDAPHIVYKHEKGNFDHEYRYRRWTGSEWTFIDLPLMGEVEDLCFTLDIHDTPHISFETDGYLYHSYLSDGGWTSIEIQSVDRFYRVPNVLLTDSAGDPHIIYRVDLGNYFRYARKEGGEWKISDMEVDCDYSTDFSAVLDADGNPHIAFHDRSGNNLKYATFDGSDTIVETVDAIQDTGDDPSIAIDQGGIPCISYKDWSSDCLKFARRSGGAWSIEVVDMDEHRTMYHTGPGEFSSLEVSPDGILHISYRGESQVRYAVGGEGSWDIFYFDDSYAGSNQEPTSLEIDSRGTPHIAYHQPEDDSIRYAVLAGEPVIPKGVQPEIHIHPNLGYLIIPGMLILFSAVSILARSRIGQPEVAEVSLRLNDGRMMDARISRNASSTKLRWNIDPFTVSYGIILLIVIILPFVPLWHNGSHYDEGPTSDGRVESEYDEDFSLLYRSGSYSHTYFEEDEYDNSTYTTHLYLPGGGEFPDETDSRGWKNDIVIPFGPVLLFIYYVEPCLFLLILFVFSLNRDRVVTPRKEIKRLGYACFGTMIGFSI
ncbi:MAG: hypothetical protein ACMUHY_05715, partial [Thermoplasmatota archaeon]